MAKKSNHENKENAYISEEPEMKSAVPPAPAPKPGSNKTVAFLKDERLIKIWGLFSLLLSIYFFVAFLSYLFSWKTDQSLVTGMGVRDFFTINPDAADNWLGMLGAMVAHLFIYKGFGLASFAFVLLFFVSGFNTLFQTQLLPIKRILQHTFFILIWLSVTFGFIFNNSWEVLGGAFGHQGFMWLKGIVGNIGTFFILLFYALVYLVVVFNINFPKANLNASKTEVASEEESTKEEISEPVPVNNSKKGNSLSETDTEQPPWEEESG